MGVDFCCGSKTFGCSYSGWNSIRNDIIIATFRYLEAVLNTMEKNEMQEDDDPNRNVLNLNELLQYYNDMKRIKSDKLIEHVSNMRLIDVNRLILFDVGGLFALCNKSDCDGYYSVGNSYDIVNLLKIIKPYMDYTKYIEEWFNTLIELFQESVELKEKISIC